MVRCPSLKSSNIFLFACIPSLIGAIQFPVPSAREFIA